MNIVIKTYSGHILTRPDTTWEKESRDFYPPDFITGLSFSPVLFTRLSKPGKSVGLKFAHRYYGTFNFGVLLLPEEPRDDSPEGFAAASCIDHTSILPLTQLLLDQAGGKFSLFKGDELLFSIDGGTLSKDQTISLLSSSLSEASRRVFLRSGDFLAVELAPFHHFYSCSEGSLTVSAAYNGAATIDMRIVPE